jgi:hypothetical protein
MAATARRVRGLGSSAAGCSEDEGAVDPDFPVDFVKAVVPVSFVVLLLNASDMLFANLEKSYPGPGPAIKIASLFDAMLNLAVPLIRMG